MLRTALKFCLALVLVSSANATLLSFSLKLYGAGATSGATNDRPVILLTNTTTAAGSSRISGFQLTLGDTTRNWDLSYYNSSGGGTGTTAGVPIRTRVSPDAVQGSIRSDVLEWTFPLSGANGFDATPTSTDEFVWLAAELDNDNVETTLDFRSILFNNGATANATMKVYFVQGGVTKTSTIILADQTVTNPASNASYASNFYTFVGYVPEPDTMSLFGAGVAAIGISWIRRRRQA